MNKKKQKFQHESQPRPIHNQSTSQWIDKHSENVGPFSYLPTPSQCNEQTKIRHRDLTVTRLEDNTLWCKDLSIKLPSTPSGDLDLVQLEMQIAVRTLFYPLK